MNREAGGEWRGTHGSNYAALVRRGVRTIDEVPEQLRDEVAKMLEE